MSDNMVERVAWNLYSKHCSIKGSKVPREFISNEDRSEYIDLAITAICAMREPTEAMQDAADHSAHPWEAMIDEALK